MNQTIVDNHIFQATKTKKNKYSCCNEDVITNDIPTDSKIVPLAVDTLGNFIASTTKDMPISEAEPPDDVICYARVNTTCRDIQTAIIKTCAYSNRFALKCAFGKEYNELYPGTIYSPSYNVHFSSTEG